MGPNRKKGLKYRGSITVFLALSLALFLSVIFALLEGARAGGLKANARMCTLQAADCLLAEYQPDLWKDYQLLFCAGERKDRFSIRDFDDRQKASITRNFISDEKSHFFSSGTYLRLTPTEVKTTAYELASDHGCRAFIHQAAGQAGRLFAKDVVHSLKELSEKDEIEKYSEKTVEEMENQAEQTLDRLKSADQAVTEKEKAEREAAEREAAEREAAERETAKRETEALPETDSGQKTVTEEPDADSRSPGAAERKKLLKDNPITQMEQSKKKGILALVMPDRDVSKKKIKTAGLFSRRTLNRGNYPDMLKKHAGEGILFRIYLNQKFSNAVDAGRDGALAYELEYILAGKTSDEANLKATVRRLLLVREGLNYACLLKDTKKQAEAAALAAALSTAFLVPEAEELLRQGILLAWAYQESVQDVRTLLSGGKVPVIKTPESWGRKSKKGLDYQQYLQILLMAKRESVLAEHAIDLIEKREDIRMDRLVSRMDCVYEYEADTIFADFITLKLPGWSGLVFREKQTLSCLV